MKKFNLDYMNNNNNNNKVFIHQKMMMMMIYKLISVSGLLAGHVRPNNREH